MSTLGWFRRALFHLSVEEASFARRGFQTTSRSVQIHLEKAGQTFIEGYHAALETAGTASLEQSLNQVEGEFRGFAFEGAGMMLALLDLVTPWRRNRLEDFLLGSGSSHVYMVHVGAGWAMARVPWARRNIEHRLRCFDPLLRWLVVDGYGFHQGFFDSPVHIRQQKVIRQLSPYAHRVFDQGLGRSLWFVEGANTERIATAIASFDRRRHADLWSGVGLACAYAGGVRRSEIKSLQDAASAFQSQLAQGAAFAAKARQRAGNDTEYTDVACRVLCGISATAAAAVTDECLADLEQGHQQSAYETWRQRVRQRIGASGSRGFQPQLHHQEFRP